MADADCEARLKQSGVSDAVRQIGIDRLWV